MKKYYFAYEDRYKKVHDQGLLWFSNEPTPELLEWVEFNQIPIGDEICEVGCGEGRDALYLSEQGFKLTAIDASSSAIEKCQEFAREKGLNVHWQAGDALYLSQLLSNRFKWVYSIATLHMLVEDEDRKQFLRSIYNLLEPNGKAFLINMGDGVGERQTDISGAFDLAERTHGASGNTMMLASTSYRAINWENHKKELLEAGFIIEKMLTTENKEYNKCMTVYLTRT